MKKQLLTLIILAFSLMVRGAEEETKPIHDTKSAPETKSAPDTVKVGVYTIGISDIDFRQKQYMVRMWIWMRYKNKDFDFAKNIEVVNCKTLERLANIVDTSGDEAYNLMELKCIMKQSWLVHDYPFDEQKLEMHVENTQYDAHDFVFAVDTSGKMYDPKLAVSGWYINDSRLYANIHEYETSFGDPSFGTPHSEYAAFNIQLHMKRNAWALFFKLFLGMYVAFFITWVGTFIHANSMEWRFQLSVGGLFAAVGNKYIIDSLLPETSMFTLVDTLHAFTFISIFITIALSVISLQFLKTDKLEHVDTIDRYTAIIVLFLYIALNIFFVYRAIYDI
ncbi:MAG: hypothetical protein ACHQK8_07940 [Bacteroidia bacterium]